MAAAPLSMQDLERALHVAAEVVARHGELYLSLFEVLEKEYQERQQRASALDRARLMAARQQALPHHSSL